MPNHLIYDFTPEKGEGPFSWEYLKNVREYQGLASWTERYLHITASEENLEGVAVKKDSGVGKIQKKEGGRK